MALPRYCRSTAAVLPRYCRSTAAVLPRYCRSTAAVLPQYCRGTAAVLPPYCRRTAVGILMYDHTFADTLRTPGAVRVDDSTLAGNNFTAQKIVLRITSYSDGSSVCDGICGVSRQVVLYHHSCTRFWTNW